jgi:hypothetical protein
MASLKKNSLYKINLVKNVTSKFGSNLIFVIDLLRYTSQCYEKFKGYLMNFSIQTDNLKANIC